MAAKNTKTLNSINKFLNKLKEVVPVDRAILFGSYARGTSEKWSDIDLAIISEGFEGKSYFERLVMLGKLAWVAKTTQIEALGFTPNEYKNPSPLDFLYEIKKKGLVVYTARS